MLNSVKVRRQDDMRSERKARAGSGWFILHYKTALLRPMPGDLVTRVGNTLGGRRTAYTAIKSTTCILARRSAVAELGRCRSFPGPEAIQTDHVLVVAKVSLRLTIIGGLK